MKVRNLFVFSARDSIAEKLLKPEFPVKISSTKPVIFGANVIRLRRLNVERERIVPIRSSQERLLH